MSLISANMRLQDFLRVQENNLPAHCSDEECDKAMKVAMAVFGTLSAVAFVGCVIASVILSSATLGTGAVFVGAIALLIIFPAIIMDCRSEVILHEHGNQVFPTPRGFETHRALRPAVNVSYSPVKSHSRQVSQDSNFVQVSPAQLPCARQEAVSKRNGGSVARNLGPELQAAHQSRSAFESRTQLSLGGQQIPGRR